MERVQEGLRTHYWIRYDRPALKQVDEGIETWAVRNHWVSITPIDLMAIGGAPCEYSRRSQTKFAQTWVSDS